MIFPNDIIEFQRKRQSLINTEGEESDPLQMFKKKKKRQWINSDFTSETLKVKKTKELHLQKVERKEMELKNYILSHADIYRAGGNVQFCNTSRITSLKSSF